MRTFIRCAHFSVLYSRQFWFGWFVYVFLFCCVLLLFLLLHLHILSILGMVFFPSWFLFNLGFCFCYCYCYSILGFVRLFADGSSAIHITTKKQQLKQPLQNQSLANTYNCQLNGAILFRRKSGGTKIHVYLIKPI